MPIFVKHPLAIRSKKGKCTKRSSLCLDNRIVFNSARVGVYAGFFSSSSASLSLKLELDDERDLVDGGGLEDGGEPFPPEKIINT